MEALASDYMAFLAAAKTEREAHDAALDLLRRAGFREMGEGRGLKPGAKVYKSRAGKALFAAVLGRRPLSEGLHAVAAHLDAPRIDVKQNPLYESGELALLDTHYYGSIKKYQWVASPLALHGVFVKPDGTRVPVVVGEDPGDPVFTITDLLIHAASEQMRKSLAEGIEGENLDVVVGSSPSRAPRAKEKIKLRALELLREKFGVSERDFLSAELEFVPAGRPREAGLDRSMILGYGQDDRACAFLALRALLDAPAPDRTAGLLLCDKEEIGSYGMSGMESDLFTSSVRELLSLAGPPPTELDLSFALGRSWAISADVDSLFDPLYPSAFEKKNAALLNHGAALSKSSGTRGKSGGNDANAEFVAEIRRIFDKAGAAWQTGEVSKVDGGGGGTIAWYLARHGMEVVDCGVGVLSMHAPWELTGKFDLYMTYKGYRAFLADDRGGR
jgi:aspartyl aminopeptidase